MKPIVKDYYFLFDIAPTSWQRTGYSRKSNSFFTRPKTRQFEAELARQAKAHWGGKNLLNGNLEAMVTFMSKKPKSTKLAYPSKDLDNMAKAIFDALNKVVYEDDRQIVKMTLMKQWHTEDQIILKLEEI